MSCTCNAEQQIAELTEIIADLKDRVLDLEDAKQRDPSPQTPPTKPWTPCDQEELEIYGNITH